MADSDTPSSDEQMRPGANQNSDAPVSDETNGEVLSSDEVETLLQDGDAPGINAHPVDLCNLNSERHLSALKSRAYQAINLSFITEVQQLLFNTLHQKVSLETLEPEVKTYSQYIKASDLKATMNLYSLQPYDTFSVVMLDRQLIFSVIEILFGGKVKNSANLEQEFGKVDLKISELVGKLVCDALQNAWVNIENIQLDHHKTSANPMLPNKISGNERYVVNKYALTVAEVRSEIHICIPYHVIDSITPLLFTESQDSKRKDQDIIWRHALKKNVMQSQITLTAQISKSKMRLKQLSNLKVGDVITIDNPETSVVFANNIKLFKAKCGTREGTRVIEITETLVK